MFESIDRTQYAAKDGGSIIVTDRQDRSGYMTILQHLVRLFHGAINNGQATHETGSINLDPPKSKLRNCTLSKRTVCDIHIYDICTKKNHPAPTKKRIYYFAGGSWQQEPTGQHWSMCSAMALEMPDTIVSMVSIPLAPNNPAPSSFPWCLKLYRTLMAEAETAGERVILAGDSSGANVILCLTLEALQEDAENGVKSSHPVALMAISPSTDLTRSNPDIEKLRKDDPLLTPEAIIETAKAWHADWDPADRKVTPMNANLSLLSQRGIKVHGITAGCDVLCPDGLKFRNKCSENNVQGEWLHWEKQMHCFVLTLPYGLREAKEGVKWVIDILKKE